MKMSAMEIHDIRGKLERDRWYGWPWVVVRDLCDDVEEARTSIVAEKARADRYEAALRRVREWLDGCLPDARSTGHNVIADALGENGRQVEARRTEPHVHCGLCGVSADYVSTSGEGEGCLQRTTYRCRFCGATGIRRGMYARVEWEPVK